MTVPSSPSFPRINPSQCLHSTTSERQSSQAITVTMDLPQVAIQHLQFFIPPDTPSINTTCNIVVLPARAGGMLTVSDSVIIDSANNGIISCPSFCGIILSLASNELHAENGHVLFEGRKECAHPLASSNSPWSEYNGTSFLMEP